MACEYCPHCQAQSSQNKQYKASAIWNCSKGCTRVVVAHVDFSGRVCPAHQLPFERIH